MDPVTTGAVAAVAEVATKEAIKKLKERHEDGPVCVTKTIPGTKAQAIVCTVGEKVCETKPHPKSGLPVTVCTVPKVTQADAKALAKDAVEKLAKK